MYAVVVSGGKQYRVSEGDTLTVDRLASAAGSTINLDQVLLVGGDGCATKIGSPTVDGARVVAEVLAHVKGDKRESFLFRRRQRTRKARGFRPSQTTLSIKQISA